MAGNVPLSSVWHLGIPKGTWASLGPCISSSLQTVAELNRFFTMAVFTFLAQHTAVKNRQQIIFMPFTSLASLQLLHFLLFLGIYLAALLSNILITTATACNHHLHTPMYFFLLSLSILDLSSFSTTGTLMGSRACVKMAVAAWGSSFLSSVLNTANTFSVTFCQSNALGQFCEIPQIFKLSCSDAYLREVGVLVVTLSLVFGCFVFIVLSYVQIFASVLRIPSEQGRHKAFSMCLPHLAVVFLLVCTGMFTQLKPSSISSPALDLVLSVLHTVVPPAVNPLIYSMRNRELRGTLKKLI
nr:PREDICTED: olfactory receptor 14A16-like [Struthio camelus australis]